MARNAVGSKGLLKHITTGEAPKLITQGEEGQEDSSDALEKWQQEECIVLSALLASLEQNLMEAYSYCETAKELWDTLKKVYGNTSNLSRVFEVKQALNSLVQEDMDFEKHLGKFRALWSELEMLRPSTTNADELNKRREQDKVFGLLLTLNPAYGGLIQHMLRDDTLPDLEEVCARIQKEHGSMGLFGKKGKELALANQASHAEKGEVLQANKAVHGKYDKFTGNCDHCKKQGHKKSQCWILHPHLKPAKFNKEARAHLGEVNGGVSSSKAQEIEVDNGKSLVAYTDKPSSILAHLAKSSPCSYKPLIIDSGASHHMISDTELITGIEPAHGNVMIANGAKIPIKGIGKLKLFDKDSKALYMPDFTSNLLSVKKCSTDLNCNVIFSPNSVKFQDIESSKVLGSGKTKGDLYVLENLNSAVAVSNFSCSFSSVSTSLSKNALWHARLGHPHNKALKLMLPGVSFENNDCEACILGKHYKTVFPNSSTIYDKCFDLVHSDVWTAPCLSRENQKYYVTFIDEKSKYTWLTLIPTKDRVLDAFKNFQSYVTNHYQAKIKIFSSAPKQITQGEDGKEIVVVDEGKWGQEDLLVLSILHSSLDGPLMDTYSHCETPKQLWDTLQRVYGNTSNLTRIYEVKRAINNLQQEEGDFTKHLGKYSQLWSELEMLRPSSNDPETLEARREQDKVFGLFFTLSPSFNDVVRHILREKELQSYDELCAQLQKEIGSDGLFGGGKGDLSMAHKVEKVESASANKAHFKPRGGGDKSVTCQPQQINTARPESMKQELRSIQHPAICAWEMMVEP
ncbi:hypothetical protein Bca101_010242 [Brassica carinata]